ncbi:MAG: hypothetical protein M3P51_02595 [Chloroflexota bacterium]|nr:hypothetical protein [Chloroflexota bacterium]
MRPEITRYIQENRATYTREAITRNLLEAGHDPEEIEQAWRSLDAPAMTRPSREFWRGFFAYVALLYGLTFLVYSQSLLQFAGLVVTAILFVLLLLSAILSIRATRASSAVARGATSGLLVAILVPFVFLVIIAGLCTLLTGAPLRGRF